MTDASSILSWGKQLLSQRREAATPVHSDHSAGRPYTPTQPVEADTAHWKKMELLRRGGPGSSSRPGGGNSGAATPTSAGVPDDTASFRSGATAATTTPPSSSAASVRESDLLSKALVHERVRLQQLKEMYRRNEQEFHSREGELLATLQRLKDQQTERVRASDASDADAATADVLTVLEEELWNEHCVLQKLIDEEVTQGAAVVAVAEVVTKCDDREGSATHNMLAGVEHLRRVAPLVMELREIALRTPVLLTPDHAASPATLEIPDLRGMPRLPSASELIAASQTTVGGKNSRPSDGSGLVVGTAGGGSGTGPAIVPVAGRLCADATTRFGTVLREIRRVDGIKQGQLQTQLDAALNHLDVQGLAIDDVHHALEQMHTDRELMVSELASLVALTARQRSLSEDAEKGALDAHGKLDAALAKRAQRAAILAERRHELEMVQREVAAMEREKTRIERRIAEVKHRCADTDEQLSTVRIDVDEMEAANQQLQRQLRAATAKDQDLARDKSKLNAELHDLRDVAQQRTHHAMDAQLRCDVAETELRVLVRDAEEYERRAEVADRAAASIQRELDESHTELAGIDRDVEETRRVASGLAKEVRDVEQQLQDLEQELDLARKILLHQEDTHASFLFQAEVGGGSGGAVVTDASPHAAKKALEFLGMPQPLTEHPAPGAATAAFDSNATQQPKQGSLSQPRQRSRQWRSASASTDRAASLEAESMPYLVGTHGMATMWGGHPVKTLTLSPERPPVLVAVEQRHYQRDRRALMEAFESRGGGGDIGKEDGGFDGGYGAASNGRLRRETPTAMQQQQQQQQQSRGPPATHGRQPPWAAAPSSASGDPPPYDDDDEDVGGYQSEYIGGRPQQRRPPQAAATRDQRYPNARGGLDEEQDDGGHNQGYNPGGYNQQQQQQDEHDDDGSELYASPPSSYYSSSQHPHAAAASRQYGGYPNSNPNNNYAPHLQSLGGATGDPRRAPQMAELPSRSDRQQQQQQQQSSTPLVNRGQGGRQASASVSQELPSDVQLLVARQGGVRTSTGGSGRPAPSTPGKGPLQERLRSMQQRLQQTLAPV